MLDWLGIQRTALVGHAWGSDIALELALDLPERVSALILTTPAVGLPPGLVPRDIAESADELMAAGSESTPTRRIRRFLAEIQRGKRLAGPAFPDKRRHWAAALRLLAMRLHNLRRIVPVFCMSPFNRQHPGRVVRPYAELSRPRWLEPKASERLAAIHHPTLILLGSRMPRARVEIAALLQQGISGAQLVRLANTGPYPQMEDPPAFNRVVLELLQAVYPGNRTDRSPVS